VGTMNRLVACGLALLFTLVPIGALAEERSSDGLSPEERLVLAAALRFMRDRNPAGAILDSEPVVDRPSRPLLSLLEGLWERAPGPRLEFDVEASTVRSFESARGVPADLSPVSAGEAKTSAAPPSELEPHPDRALPVAKRRSIVRLSRVGFSERGTQALVYATEFSGPLWGGGFYLVLEKQGEAWVVTHQLMAWIS